MSKAEKRFEKYQFSKAAAGDATSAPVADACEFNFRHGKPAGQALKSKEPFSVQRFLLKYGLMTRRKPVREG